MQINNEINILTNKKSSMTNKFNIITPNGMLKLYNQQQLLYIENIMRHDVNFGIGPAGTGKTFLAVACAVLGLQQHNFKKIILVRPVIEAGEQLGFLPGDLTQKINPYMQPLYDALNWLLGVNKVEKYLQQQVIEIAPLAYMRGRTLNDAFIILDEGQNTTIEQMKMFLTRLGFNSKIVVTGDLTQIDLPKNRTSGLKHALQILKSIPKVNIMHFSENDIVRHPIVKKIIIAYQELEYSVKDVSYDN